MDQLTNIVSLSFVLVTNLMVPMSDDKPRGREWLHKEVVSHRKIEEKQRGVFRTNDTPIWTNTIKLQIMESHVPPSEIPAIKAAAKDAASSVNLMGIGVALTDAQAKVRGLPPVPKKK